MSRVEFSFHPQEANDELDFDELRVTVDGRPLAELVAEIEIPFAEAEGHPDIAGGYVGVNLSFVSSPLVEHFLGGPRSALGCGSADQTVLLGCCCGEPGCWPLLAHVDVERDRVVWREFEQPHRAWPYNGFELEFDRAQYELALQDAQAAIAAAQ